MHIACAVFTAQVCFREQIDALMGVTNLSRAASESGVHKCPVGRVCTRPLVKSHSKATQQQRQDRQSHFFLLVERESGVSCQWSCPAEGRATPGQLYPPHPVPFSFRRTEDTGNPGDRPLQIKASDSFRVRKGSLLSVSSRLS